MDKEELKRIAKIAGLMKGQHWDRSNLDSEHLMMFFELAVQYEREACARKCEEYGSARVVSGEDCAALIRARNK